MESTYLRRAGDCKSSIREFDSHPRLHSLARVGEKRFGVNYLQQAEIIVSISDFVKVNCNILLHKLTKKVSLKFSHNGTAHTILLNCSLTELTETDVVNYVTNKINEIDNVISLNGLCEFLLDCKNGFRANADTRKKSVGHFRDLLKRDGISLDENTKTLLSIDEQGRTLPERWEEIYNLPHKLRQIKALFCKKNLLLFKRQGWETKNFGNFVSFIAETTISQPFSTSDDEVERIQKFFADHKESDPIFYDIYLLAFGAGLRKSEIYQVNAEDFTIFNGQHFLLLPFSTKGTKLRGTGSVEKVGISEQLYSHFQGRSGKVIKGGDRLHKRFIKFLKNDLGITDNKACHRLRKILGARLATEAGIFHASKTLRNSVSVCERYYSDLTAHKNNLSL